MAGPMVLTYRDEDVLVNVERGGQPLRKNIHDVVIAIGTVIEFDAKRVLPFLRFENMIRVRGVKNEALEIELAHTTQLRPRLEGYIGIVANAVIAFEKSNLGIEIGTDLAMLAQNFEPAILIIHPGPKVCLSGRKSRRPRLGRIAG